MNRGGEAASEKYAKRRTRPVFDLMETQNTPQLALARKKGQNVKRSRYYTE